MKTCTNGKGVQIVPHLLASSGSYESENLERKATMNNAFYKKYTEPMSKLKLRTYVIDDKPFFSGVDIAKLSDIHTATLYRRVPKKYQKKGCNGLPELNSGRGGGATLLSDEGVAACFNYASQKSSARADYLSKWWSTDVKTDLLESFEKNKEKQISIADLSDTREHVVVKQNGVSTQLQDQTAELPDGYVLVRETEFDKKTERLQLLIRPSLKTDLQQEADKRGVSVNELCNQLLTVALEQNITYATDCIDEKIDLEKNEFGQIKQDTGEIKQMLSRLLSDLGISEATS